MNTLAKHTRSLTTRASMHIFVNDERREITPPLTLAGFMEGLAMGTLDGVAVAANGTVVPRPAWASQQLAEADRLLIIQATQGG
jgi:sulfur carrier protein